MKFQAADFPFFHSASSSQKVRSYFEKDPCDDGNGNASIVISFRAVISILSRPWCYT